MNMLTVKGMPPEMEGILMSAEVEFISNQTHLLKYAVGCMLSIMYTRVTTITINGENISFTLKSFTGPFKATVFEIKNRFTCTEVVRKDFIRRIETGVSLD